MAQAFSSADCKSSVECQAQSYEGPPLVLSTGKILESGACSLEQISSLEENTVLLISRAVSASIGSAATEGISKKNWQLLVDKKYFFLNNYS